MGWKSQLQKQSQKSTYLSKILLKWSQNEYKQNE